MANEGGFGAQVKVWLETFREGLIIFVVLFVLCFPKWTADYLSQFGLETLKTPLGDIDLSKMRQAAGGVEAARRDVSDAAAALKVISQSLPQEARDKVTSVVTGLDSTAAQLKVPDEVLATAVQTQKGKQPTEQSRQGWIYVGHTDEAKQTWSPSPTVVQMPTPSFKVGDDVTIADDVYVRAESGTAQRNQAPVIGVVRAGEKVRVMEMAYTHALRGGWFLWLRINAV